MGSLFYGASRHEITFDDATLAHVQLVTVAKLRRNEPFLLTWRSDSNVPNPHGSVWIDRPTELNFVFENPDTAETDRDRLDEMAAAANSAHGLRVRSIPDAKT